MHPIGTWALIERSALYWTKGRDGTIRILYDVGMGREFTAEELQSENGQGNIEPEAEDWHIIRIRNKWQSTEETVNHPCPGTFPVLVTGEAYWGGWRVPGAE